jgi:hypothetical protein
MHERQGGSAGQSLSPLAGSHAARRLPTDWSDNSGERCPICPVRDLCESDDRWLVRGISSGLEFG